MYNPSVMFFIIIYLFFFLLLVVTWRGGSIVDFERSLSQKHLQYLLVIFIGLPPSHMFFFKIQIIDCFLGTSMFFEFLLFILINIMALYIYAQILITFREVGLEKSNSHSVNTFIMWLWGVWLVHPLLFDYWNF